MGFRYDMQGKSPQQQEIVRQKDEVEKKKNEVGEQKKIEEFQNSVTYEIAPRKADYEGIFIKSEDKYLLELRVSGTALVNGPCGLNDIDITEWLFQTGKEFVYDVKKYEVILISSTDVLNARLITNWKNLKRIEEKQI